MTSSIRSSIRTNAAIIIVALLTLAPSVSTPAAVAAEPQSGDAVSGAGSTWSANALQQWIRTVFDNYGWTITFDPSGSSAGRQQFAQGTQDFGVSEIPYALAGSDSPDPRPKRSFAYIPIVAGGTSFMYNLVIGGKRVTNLRLSGEVVAKIFTGVITKWSDPAIAADNPKLALPAITIVPVVRSDGSGTTAQLTSWIRSQYPSLWTAYCGKAGRANCGITSNYPIVPGSAFLGQQGSDGVAGQVAQSKSVGAITYVEASYALNARFPVAKVLNSAGFYTEPTASNVAVSLLAAVINNDSNSPDYLTASLAGVYTNPDPRTYPLSSYSYMIIPTAVEGQFTARKGLTLANFTSYFLCEGQQVAEVLGYSPLPVNLASAGLEQIQKIPGGDPQNKTIASCNNPTFSSDGSNKLAASAPQPQECDKRGADQCLTGTGGAADTATASSSGAAASSGTKDKSKAGAATGSGANAGGKGVDTSAGGAAVGLTGGGDPVVAGSPIDLPGRGLPFPALLGMLLAVALALFLVLLPPVLARQRAALAAGVRQRAPNHPKKRGKWRPSTPAQMALPKVHLPALFRKGGSAVPPKGDS